MLNVSIKSSIFLMMLSSLSMRLLPSVRMFQSAELLHTPSGMAVNEKRPMFVTIVRRDYLGLSGTIWDYLGLSWTIWDCQGLSGTIMDYLGLSGTIFDYLGLSGTIWDYLELS